MPRGRKPWLYAVWAVVQGQTIQWCD